MPEAERVRLIIEGCHEIQVKMKAHGRKCDEFAQEAIAWRLDWCTYGGIDIDTAIEHVAARYVPANRQAT